MKRHLIIISLLIIFFSCKKNSSKPATVSVTDADLQGKWRLISETRSGTYNNTSYIGLPTDFLEYKSDGKAYSFIQGQNGLIYSYNLNTIENTLNFMYIAHLNNPPHACTASPGCPRLAEVRFISTNLLVLSNTFRDTISGQPRSITIIDSLTK